jgi:hypothetical protein
VLAAGGIVLGWRVVLSDRKTRKSRDQGSVGDAYIAHYDAEAARYVDFQSHKPGMEANALSARPTARPEETRWDCVRPGNASPARDTIPVPITVREEQHASPCL